LIILTLKPAWGQNGVQFLVSHLTVLSGWVNIYVDRWIDKRTYIKRVTEKNGWINR
jgi:uncharacterized protein YbgA (DUF1722 family)